MQIRVKFYLGFRELFGDKEKEIELPGKADIKDLLGILCDSEQRRQKVFDNCGQLSKYINMLKNGRDVRFLQGTETKLQEGDVVTMFPPVGGG